MKHAPLFLALATTLLLSLTGCGHPEDSTGKAPAPRIVQAETAVTRLSKGAALYAAPANIVAEHQAQIASRLMGYLREIAVVEGQAVSAGQRLFSIDAVDVQGQVEQARAGLQQAEDAQRDARIEFDRFTALLKEEAVSKQQFDKIKLQHDMAAARVAQARAGLNTASNQLRYATVIAPFAGVVTRKLANAGDLASPGQPVLVLENPAKLQIQTAVPESVLRGLKSGQTVTVEIDGQTAPVAATVAQISPAADPISRLFTIKLNTAAKGLRSGLFARALFADGEREALTIPQDAVITRAGIRGVFVVGADQIAQFRMLRTGATLNGQVEIQAGLTPGERIVTRGAEKLESGDKIGG